ncbi:hypothetical protein BG004_000419 [Podila humilis]|nr:hypothetical protein BG004_000419 [Podila humilis]
MTGRNLSTIPKSWFKKRNRSKLHLQRHPNSSAISSPSTATGSSSIRPSTRLRQASTSSSIESCILPQVQTATTHITITNRSSTGMTAVSSSSALAIFPGSQSAPVCGQGRLNTEARISSSSFSSLPYSGTAANVSSNIRLHNPSHTSLPARLQRANHGCSQSHTSVVIQGCQPPSCVSSPLSPPPPPPPPTLLHATKPPSKHAEQLRNHPLSAPRLPHQHPLQSNNTINGYPTRTVQAAAQISVSSITESNNNGHVAWQAPHYRTSCTPPPQHPQYSTQPHSTERARRSQAKRQSSKILRNLSARFGSSTDTFPVVEAPETEAQEYARTIKALWRMVEEEELSQLMADATPAEREWIIRNNTTFPYTDVTMADHDCYSNYTRGLESIHSCKTGTSHTESNSNSNSYSNSNSSNSSSSSSSTDINLFVRMVHPSESGVNAGRYSRGILHQFKRNSLYAQTHANSTAQSHSNTISQDGQIHLLEYQNRLENTYSPISSTNTDSHRHVAPHSASHPAWQPLSHPPKQHLIETENVHDVAHRFSTGTATSDGVEDAGSLRGGEYCDRSADNNHRFTFMSQVSTATVSTEALNQDLQTRSQDWYQQQLQEHGYQGYNSHFIARQHCPSGTLANTNLQYCPSSTRLYDDNESDEDEFLATERKRQELEELEQQLCVLGLQRYSTGPSCFQEGEMGEFGHFGGREYGVLRENGHSDDDDGVIEVARKVPIRDSFSRAL